MCCLYVKLLSKKMNMQSLSFCVSVCVRERGSLLLHYLDARWAV